MGTTTKRALRWPTPTVGVKPNVAQDIRNLAEDVDAAFTGSVTITDWNAATVSGSYVGGSNTANAPEGSTSTHFGFVIASSGGSIEQFLGRADGGTGTNPMFHRYYSQSSASWTAWARLIDDSAFAVVKSIGSVDLNTLSTTGTFQGGSLTNAPLGSPNSFLVEAIYRDSSNQLQTVHNLADGTHWWRLKQGGTWKPWAQINDSSNDTGWLLSPLASASGWSAKTDPDGNTSGTITGGVRAVGQFVEYRFRVTRTGGNLTADSTGNLADTTLATVSPTAWPNLVPSTAVYDNFFVVGVRQGSIRFDQTGTFQITDLYPADTISTGDVIQISVRFLAG